MRTAVLTLALLVGCSGLAHAQAQQDPLPLMVVDVRGSFVTLGLDARSLTDLGISNEDFPTHAPGVGVGVQLYVLRRPSWAFGVGGEWLHASDSDQPLDSNGMRFGPRVDRALDALSGQLSLNFGHRMGWSYLTGGIGPATFQTYFQGTTPDGLRGNTLNYGGGARWFHSEHLAFTLDLRFYATSPANATLFTTSRDRQRIVVMAAGISIK